MNTIIINGSPKGKNGNSEIFIKQFIKEMKSPYEVKYICSEDPKLLAKYVESFENIILVLPLYIHSMPGITMRFINYLEPAKDSEKNLLALYCNVDLWKQLSANMQKRILSPYP